MTSKKKISRRRFSDDFKRRVVAEASHPNTSWSEVALRYELNTNLLFKWKEKFEAEVSFLPVELGAPVSHVPAVNETVDCIENDEYRIQVDVAPSWVGDSDNTNPKQWVKIYLNSLSRTAPKLI